MLIQKSSALYHALQENVLKMKESLPSDAVIFLPNLGICPWSVVKCSCTNLGVGKGLIYVKPNVEH